MIESSAIEYLRLIREASYTAIVLAVALAVCCVAAGGIRNARERERRRRLERERIAEDYRRMFEGRK